MKKINKLNIACEKINDLARNISDCAITLENKAESNEIDRLDERLNQEFTLKRNFMNLKSTVSNKAEWTDLNDHIVKFNELKDVVSNHTRQLNDIEDGFKTFQETTNESGQQVEEACSTLKHKFGRIEERIKQNESSGKLNEDKIV